MRIIRVAPPGQPDAQRIPLQPLPPGLHLRGVWMDLGDSGRDGGRIRGEGQRQTEQGTVPTKLHGSLAIADDLPRPLSCCQQAMQPPLDPQYDFPSPRRHQGNIPNALQGVPHTLFGVQENASAFECLTLPLGLAEPSPGATGASRDGRIRPSPSRSYPRTNARVPGK